MNISEYFTQNINNLQSTRDRDLAREKRDFLKYNKKYVVLYLPNRGIY